jgi:hypothetical protein
VEIPPPEAFYFSKRICRQVRKIFVKKLFETGYNQLIEKLEIVKEHGEPALRASHKSQRLAFAAFGGEKCSNYFQDSAHFDPLRSLSVNKT